MFIRGSLLNWKLVFHEDSTFDDSDISLYSHVTYSCFLTQSNTSPFLIVNECCALPFRTLSP